MSDAAASLLVEGSAYFAELKALDCKPNIVHFEIDGLVYTNTKLPCSIGLEVWPRVTSLFGSAFTRAVVTGEIDQVGASAIVGVADKAIALGLVPLVKDLLARMKCGDLSKTGKGGDVLPQFDEHFAGEYGHLAKVVAFAMAHNLRGPTYGAR